MLACTQPTEHVANNTDCNDNNENIHPAAIEQCDTFDNNCDGVTDGSDAQDAQTWYLDDDGDGFGDNNTSTTECSAPTGYISDNSDCDDTTNLFLQALRKHAMGSMITAMVPSTKIPLPMPVFGMQMWMVTAMETPVKSYILCHPQWLCC